MNAFKQEATQSSENWEMNMLLDLVLLFFAVFPCSRANCNIKLTPTPNLTTALDEFAFFHCTTNANDGQCYVIWRVDDKTNEGQRTGGLYNSTLKLKAEKKWNESRIECETANFESECSTLYIQGEILEVVNFSCTQDGPCTWGQPWTLPGINILSYNITVMQGKVLELIITNNTFWQYCPKTIEGFSEYNITVAAVSDVGIGKSQTKTSELNPINLNLTEAEYDIEKDPTNNLYIMSVKMTNSFIKCVHLKDIEGFVVKQDTSNTNMSFKGMSAVMISDNTLSIKMNLSINSKWIFRLMVTFNDEVISFNDILISTFDVQNASVTKENPVQSSTEAYTSPGMSVSLTNLNIISPTVPSKPGKDIPLCPPACFGSIVALGAVILIIVIVAFIFLLCRFKFHRSCC